MMESIAKIDRR